MHSLVEDREGHRMDVIHGCEIERSDRVPPAHIDNIRWVTACVKSPFGNSSSSFNFSQFINHEATKDL